MEDTLNKELDTLGEELMAEADAALYVAKAQGGNTVHPAIGGQLVR